MRFLRVKVVTKAKEDRIILKGDSAKIYTTASPEKGKANQKIIGLLAEFFRVKKTQVQIVKGFKIRDKTIVIKL